MRIISKDRDYYDNIVGYDSDASRIYNRVPRTALGEFPLTGWNERHFWRNEKDRDYPKYEHTVWSNNRFSLDYFYVLFAGKLYGGLEFIRRSATLREEREIIWDLKALENTKTHGLFESKYEKEDWKRAVKVLSIRGDEVLRDWAIANNIVIAMCGHKLQEDRNPIIAYDPILKEFDFQRVLDPFTAYQELDQWIGGVIGNKELIPEMSDKDKIVSHGFDPKWSFRKHKDDNK